MKIQVENLKVELGRKVILKNISCCFQEHIYGLMGSNGSGKTTFMRTLLGLYTFQQGDIWIYDDNNQKKNIKEIQVGYLPQEFDVFKDLTVFDHLKYFCVLKDIVDYENEIDRVLTMTHLQEQKKVKCKKLSGGMVRRLGIAQSLLGTPDLLVLDEPTAGLDIQERVRFKEIIGQLQMQIPIIISTHIVEDISSLCSAIMIIKNGEICYQGKTNELIDSLSNRVYSCLYSNKKDIKEDVVIISEKNDRVVLVSKEELQYDFLIQEDVTLEDAYLYLNEVN
ncbi:MAG: ATP-binding cassette domain-containing protein [Longibaculum sp.]